MSSFCFSPILLYRVVGRLITFWTRSQCHNAWAAATVAAMMDVQRAFTFLRYGEDLVSKKIRRYLKSEKSDSIICVGSRYVPCLR